MIIEPPSPFAPASEWRDFLAELETLRPERVEDVAEISRYKEMARDELRALDPSENFS